MTGKEALLDLIDTIKYTHSDGKTLLSYDKKITDIIMKDLEVLEILKKHEPNFWWLKILTKVEEYNKKYIDIPALKKRILTEEEFKLLKEWLEK